MEHTEQQYTWENFKEETICQNLLAFFSEFSGGTNDTVIFVSRKSYCLFLLLREKNVITVGNNPIYVDRLIMKSTNPDDFTGEVFLVDDTISTGRHLAEVCREVLQRTKYSKIKLRVFAKDKQFDERNYVASHFPKEVDKIDLTVQMAMETSQRLRFSSIETLLYHQENIPYFIELPYLTEDNEKDLDYITLQEEEYNALQHGGKAWKFYKCDQSGYRQNLIENAVIVMDNGFVNFFPEFVYDFVIRVQIMKNPDETRNVIFSPFAILKSVRFDELENYFFNIYNGTEYAQKLKDQKEKARNFATLHYKTLYRAVVYAFSYYIGLNFISFLNASITRRNLKFQKRNDKYCYETSFLDAINTIFQAGVERFFLSAFLFKGFSNVEKRMNFNSLISSIGKYGRLEGNFRTTYHYLWALFNDLKEDMAVKEIESETLRKFLSIEELQEAVSLSCFAPDAEIKDVLTCSICSMLEQGKISNEITYDNRKKVVYRGFNYAENSEAVFDVAEKAFYAAAASYLKKVREENYEKKYNRFLSVLKNFLVDNSLMGSVITMDEFQIYSEIYRRQSDAKKMDRLTFLIENKIPTYIDQVSKHIEDIDWNAL